MKNYNARYNNIEVIQTEMDSYDRSKARRIIKSCI